MQLQNDSKLDSFQKRLKFARQSAGISQEKMANKLGMKRGTSYARYESGERNMPISKMERFAAICGRSLEWLRYGAESDSVAHHKEPPSAGKGLAYLEGQIDILRDQVKYVSERLSEESSRRMFTEDRLKEAEHRYKVILNKLDQLIRERGQNDEM
jgi:transcriptional regulator with XRE-family HTH domain